MRAIALCVGLIAGCYSPAYEDCQISCSTTCPSGLSCMAGMCRTNGATGACGSGSNIDAPRGIDAIEVDGPPNDIDGDGILNVNDNCPNKSNPDQANEDMDPFGDVCDPCPPLFIVAGADQNMDSDGDGVGDGCDPHPTTAGDRIVLFEGFRSNTLPMSAVAIPASAWTFANGQAHVTVGVNASADLVWLGAASPSATVSARGAIDMVMSGALQPAGGGVIDQFDPPADRGTNCDIGTLFGSSPFLMLIDGPTTVATNNLPANAIGTVTTLTSTRTGAVYRCAASAFPGIEVNGNGASTVTNPGSGLHATAATAHFDWVMVVTGP